MDVIDKFNRFVDTVHPDQPLSEDAMEIMIMVMMSGNDPMFSDNNNKFTEIVTSDHELLDQMPQAKVFVLRIEQLTGLKLTVGAMLMMAVNIETFGDSTMYAYYLHRKCNPDKIITVDLLSTDIFPMGMLSKEQRHKMWELQKITKDVSRDELEGAIGLGADNMLDYAGLWK